MEVTYWDEDFFEERTVTVVENLGGLKKGIKLSLAAKKIAGNIKKQFQKNSYDFCKAINCNLEEEEYILFSPKLRPVFDKIRANGNCDALKAKEWVILFCDFIIPVANGATDISSQQKMFTHSWLLYSSSFLWDDTEELVQRDLWKLCYNDTSKFEKFVLSEDDQIVKDLQKYPELKTFSIPIPYHENETLDALLSYRGKVPEEVLGYVLRGFYKTNTLNLSTEMLHKAFDGMKREQTMNSAELETFDNFPETLTIYRGTNADEAELRPSWSLDKERVSNTFASGKKLFTAKIKKDKVIAYWADEDEIIAWVDKSELI